MANRGDIFAGFRLTERLGGRAKGEVWRAVGADGHAVALRVLPVDPGGADAIRARRLADEVSILRELGHPNIAPVLLTGREGGRTFIVAELVEGENLAGRPMMDATAFFGVAVPLASAIVAANERKVLHGDLNPRNVVLTSDGTVKVLDFCAREMHHNEPEAGLDPDDVPTETLTHERDVALRSLPYCAPERVQVKPLDTRADIYSLGAVLYEMATGRPPFAAETAADLMAAVLRDLPPPISEANPRLPAELDRTIGRTLVKDRTKRLQATRFLLEDLERLAASGS